MSSRTAAIEAILSTVARFATIKATVTGNITGTALVKAVLSTVARVATIEATPVQETTEWIQVTKREPRRNTAVNVSAWVATIKAVLCSIAGFATIEAVSGTITRSAVRRGSEQVPQTSAQSESGNIADRIARVAGSRITRIASENRIARIAIDSTNSVRHQPLQTGEQIAFRGRLVTRRSTRVDACTGVCKALNTQHEGGNKGCH